jgi:hypothetical protein
VYCALALPPTTPPKPLATPTVPLLLLGFGEAAAAVARAAGGARAVVATTRTQAKTAAIEAAGARALVSAELTGELVGREARGADVLVSFPPDGSTDQRIAPALSAARRIVYISSTGVYGGHRGKLDDGTPVAPAAPRAGPRLAAESAYRAQGAIVLRAPGLYGPGSGLHLRLLAGTYRVPGDGSGHISRLHLDDLAALVLAAFERGQPGETFVVGDLAPVQQIEVIRFLCGRMRLPIPPSAPLDEVSPTLRGSREVDAGRALAALGVGLRYPTYREGFEHCLAATAWHPAPMSDEGRASAGEAWFIELDVEPCAGLNEGAQLRFKAISPARPIARAAFEAAGLSGDWRVEAVDAGGELLAEPARTANVEDSSDGTACLVYGGEGGLLLTHEASGARRREAYLLLALGTRVSLGCSGTQIAPPG